MHSLAVALSVLRAPIAVSILTALIFFLPAQSREIFVAMRESGEIVDNVRAIAFTILLAFVLLAASVALITNAPANRRADVIKHHKLLQSITAALALLPIFGLIYVNITFANNPTKTAFDFEKVFNIAVIVVSLALILLLTRYDRVRYRIIRIGGRVVRFLDSLGFTLSALIFLFFFAAIIIVVTFEVNFAANLLGPVCIICLFLMVLTIALSALTYVYDRFQFPAISLLMGGAFLWSILGWNDNHEIRSETAAIAKPVTQEFAAWLSSRPDLGNYTNEPYPVYIISSEGGGIYASVHAALTLAHIQDNCPAFARHVFIISGVSGGSVGSSLFAALMRAFPVKEKLEPQEYCPMTNDTKGPLQKRVKHFFKSDFLTPQLAAGLFPDFLQRFLPFRVKEFDRARAFELSFETAWERVMTGAGVEDQRKLFANNIRTLWTQSGDSPALALNTTLLHTGTRAVVSTFKLRDDYILTDTFLDILNEETSVSLSTAASLSARFPLISPAGRFWDEYKRSYQFVDGGYFDNSGIDTAMHIGEKLRDTNLFPVPSAPDGVASKCMPANTVRVRLNPTSDQTVPPQYKDVCFKFIIIKATTGTSSVDAEDNHGEFRAPINAVLNARQGRQVITRNNLIKLFCSEKRCIDTNPELNPHVYLKQVFSNDLSLGWLMSANTLNIILDNQGGVAECNLNSERRRLSREEAIALNECMRMRIKIDLAWRLK